MEPPSHSDRYDVSGNVEAQYVDVNQTVLVNKRGIVDLKTLQIEEEAALARTYETLLQEVQLDTPMSCELIKETHQRIFGDLFQWAGRWRTVQISKPGAIWPAAQYLDQSMDAFKRETLAKYPLVSLTDDEKFCTAIGEIQGEFLAIHPFREGNARTIKVVTDLLAAQSGRRFLISDQTADGADSYIEAASAALLRRDYRLMIEQAREALTRSRESKGPATA